MLGGTSVSGFRCLPAGHSVVQTVKEVVVVLIQVKELASSVLSKPIQTSTSAAWLDHQAPRTNPQALSVFEVGTEQVAGLAELGRVARVRQQVGVLHPTCSRPSTGPSSDQLGPYTTRRHFPKRSELVAWDVGCS